MFRHPCLLADHASSSFERPDPHMDRSETFGLGEEKGSLELIYIYSIIREYRDHVVPEGKST